MLWGLLKINNKVSKGKQEGGHDKSFIHLYICKTSIALKKIYIRFGFNQKSLIGSTFFFFLNSLLG